MRWLDELEMAFGELAALSTIAAGVAVITLGLVEACR